MGRIGNKSWNELAENSEVRMSIKLVMFHVLNYQQIKRRFDVD